MKNIAKVSLVIIGSLIGAGFASGQEIFMFFNCYGIKGILGIIISCTITALIIYKVFQIINKYNIQHYSQFLAVLNKNKKANKIIQNIVQIFLLISFYIMVAGFCAYFKQEWKIPIYISAIIMAILCYLTFHKNIKGVISINTILMPILILFVIYLGTKNIQFTTSYFRQQANWQIGNTLPFKWIISSILYASYNSILLIPMLIELREYISAKSKIKNVAIKCSSILAVLGICLFCLLLRANGYNKELELPMLQIVKEFGKVYPHIYGIVIVTAIFTSAISAGYGFLSNLNPKKYTKYVIIICSTAILIAPIGFTNLVNVWYPFFGVLGLIQIFLLYKKQ